MTYKANRNGPSVSGALLEVLAEMKKLTPEELRTELDKHADGDLAVALKETTKFYGEFYGTTTTK